MRIENQGESGGEPEADLVVRSAPLSGTTIAPEEIPGLVDELPVLAVAASQARGITEIRGARELRHKECDRIAAMAAGLRALGAEVLVVLSNVPGLLADPQDPSSRIPSGDLGEWGPLEEAATGNMKRKLLAYREALEGGVPRAVLGDGRVEAPLRAALAGGGTHLWAACCTAVGA